MNQVILEPMELTKEFLILEGNLYQDSLSRRTVKKNVVPTPTSDSYQISPPSAPEQIATGNSIRDCLIETLADVHDEDGTVLARTPVAVGPSPIRPLPAADFVFHWKFEVVRPPQGAIIRMEPVA